MKPRTAIDAELHKNEDAFQDDFFKRFRLRRAPQPLQLDGSVSRDYLFPTLYSDVTCAMGIFLCSYEKAQKMMLHPRIKPVRMPKGRSLVIFSCYEYKNVMSVAPYNEIAVTIPVMVDPFINPPVLPMLLNVFPGFGFHVVSMPVTSLENQLRGLKIWGIPKVLQEIDIRDEGDDCVTTAFESTGEEYIELRIPKSGKPTSFDVGFNLYTRLGDRLLRGKTCFKADFMVTKHMDTLFTRGKKPDRPYLTLSDTPCAEALKGLEIEEQPFQLRYARGVKSCFDLPDAQFRSPSWFKPSP